MSTPTTATGSTASSSEGTTQPTTAPSTYDGDGAESNAESSKMAAATSPSGPQPNLHAVHLTDYIFNVGYMQQQWADVQLTFFSDALKLHRIILARSPYLAQYFVNAAPGTTIHLKFRDDNITSESVHICIHHLYNPAFHLVTPSNARAVLASSLLLSGMPELVHHAYTVCRDSITAESLPEWLSWVAATAERPAAQTGGAVQGENAWEEGSVGRYGEWSARIKQDIFDYLTQTLPSSAAPSSSGTLSTALLPAYLPLPYPLFKRALESPSLPFPSKQDRFAFAKKAIAARKRGVAAASATGMEEAAVLAFKGGDEGMEVEITRKGRKGRALWKVEG